MDRFVHYELTQRWAAEEGFDPSSAALIASSDWAVDKVHHVREWKNKGYHFAWLGAHGRARRLMRRAITERDLVALGEALHCEQDALGHGVLGHFWHWDGIDRWERRGPAVRDRIEAESRRLLRAYRDAVMLG